MRPDLCYTDGVTEAENGEGDDRLREVIAASLGASVDETIRAICGALAAFTGGAEPADDVTVVVVRRVLPCPGQQYLLRRIGRLSGRQTIRSFKHFFPTVSDQPSDAGP